MRFAKRTSWEGGTNPLIRCLSELREKGQAIIDLTESNPTRCHLPFPIAEIIQPLSDDQSAVYTPTPFGHIPLREALAQHYSQRGISARAENIFLTASTSEAYSVLFRLLVDAGDEILIPFPSYPLFSLLADINDVKVIPYRLCYDALVKKWFIDKSYLKNLSFKRGRILVVVNPNNPTGSYIKAEEIDEINAFCKKHHMAIISDEVFWEFPLGKLNESPCSLAGNGEVLTFSFGGASKSFGLPQMKLAWTLISGPLDQIASARRKLEVILDTYLSVNTPIQHAAMKWLALQPQLNRILKERLNENVKWLTEQEGRVKGMSLRMPEGGWYVVMALPETVSEESFCLELLEEKHVFVHPGYFFDFEKEGFLVLSLLPPPEIFQEGCGRLFEKLGQYA